MERSPLRVAMVSKACLVGAYQTKLEHLARQPGVQLTLFVPPSWRDSRGETRLERAHTDGYTLHTIPIAFNGRFHIHFYPTLARHLRHLRPDILHMDEEPYNLATWLALRTATRLGIAACFFTWQNLHRRYPPPFRWFEGYNFRHAAHAIAGSQAAADVLRQKGYGGPLSVIPQFGIEPDDFRPTGRRMDGQPFIIGYAGGLVAEKGVDLLIRAASGLPGDWRLRLAGEGTERVALEQLAAQLGLAARVEFAGRVPSTVMPRFYQGLDVLVLPSRTRPNWMEQFGRVLVEAMACGVAVVGSDSGEIPNVIGDAGLIFHENDIEGLRVALQRLQDDPALRHILATKGRQRVLQCFTQQSVAEATYQVYQQMLEARAKK